MVETQAQSVVVFDGECPFCIRQVERIQRRDMDHSLEYVPRQTPGIDDRFPQLSDGDFDTGMRLIMPDGRVYVGADAVYHIARRLPLWRRFAWAYRVPGVHGLARLAYGWVAANRRKLGRACPADSCPTRPDAD